MLGGKGSLGSTELIRPGRHATSVVEQEAAYVKFPNVSILSRRRDVSPAEAVHGVERGEKLRHRVVEGRQVFVVPGIDMGAMLMEELQDLAR
ncbi:hypothetical protein BN1723_014416, partial [Verticillium longisporum]